MSRFILIFLLLFSSCAAQKESSRVGHRKLKKMRIMIDPGHGGADYGTYSRTKPRIHEKHLVLQTAYMVVDLLRKKGYYVSMSRTKDVALPLTERAELAKERRVNLFVSLHYNSAPNEKAQGIEVFYYPKEDERSEESKLLAKRVLDRMIQQTRASSRGVKPGNFSVLRNTKMPAILVEGGFLTNSEELAKIRDSSYMKRLAFGIAQGVDEHVKAMRKK